MNLCQRATRTSHLHRHILDTCHHLQDYSAGLLNRNAAYQFGTDLTPTSKGQCPLHFRPYLELHESYGLSRNTASKHRIRHASSASLQLRHRPQAHLHAIASAVHASPPLRPVQAARHLPSSRAWACSNTATTSWFNQPRAYGKIAFLVHSPATLLSCAEGPLQPTKSPHMIRTSGCGMRKSTSSVRVQDPQIKSASSSAGLSTMLPLVITAILLDTGVTPVCSGYHLAMRVSCCICDASLLCWHKCRLVARQVVGQMMDSCTCAAG